ncbi:hypothetical protein [Vibrio sp. 99-70-13A1]|uniref:DarT1-associated NADAR antitoxin family protein n=1 Tax=Vibrio sp. 99-70-13A1 TaxID=2607601 RepID=UPI001493D28B|nr:hypothetical protein [Vibrio sp. 99-70-13A1]NOH99405.1 hypothetical protein [Vibrio sp. 99-70-13A1]
MADRPIFIPKVDEVGVKEVNINFKWHSGFALVQKQKTIHELHERACGLGFSNILEISSKSPDTLGVNLSAFNLLITTQKKNQSFSVESAFQGSKVFDQGGPYLDLFAVDSKTAKKDPRIKSSGNLECFLFFNQKFPILPRTYFYDWLYINALMQHPKLAEQVMLFNGFSDIEFNPEKSINCQAHAVALFISLISNGIPQQDLKNPESFLEFTRSHYENQKRAVQVQSKMF